MSKANLYYKLFISWTNQKIKETYIDRYRFCFLFSCAFLSLFLCVCVCVCVSLFLGPIGDIMCLVFPLQWSVSHSFSCRNVFDFKHIRTFDRSLLNEPGMKSLLLHVEVRFWQFLPLQSSLITSGPMVLFATPGMLHAGKCWFCVGTLFILQKAAQKRSN